MRPGDFFDFAFGRVDKDADKGFKLRNRLHNFRGFSGVNFAFALSKDQP